MPTFAALVPLIGHDDSGGQNVAVEHRAATPPCELGPQRTHLDIRNEDIMMSS